MVNNLENKINLKDEKRRKSTNSIIKAAQAIFVKRGFAGASMSQIAKQAQVPQALIYHYFKSKEDLWKAVKKSGLENAHQSADFGGKDAGDYPDFLRVVLKNRAEFYKQNPELRKLIQWEALEGETSEKLLGIGNTYEGIWTKDLERLQNSGKLAKSIDAKLLSALIRNAVMGVFDDVPHLFKAKEVAKKQDEYLKLVFDVLVKLAS